MGEKTQKFFLEEPLFLVFKRNVYRGALTPQNFLCPENFMVARLQLHCFVKVPIKK